MWLFTATIVLCTAPWLIAPDWAWVWTPVLVAYLLRHLYLLTRLALLIRRHHRLIPPFPRGLWGEIYRSIARRVAVKIAQKAKDMTAKFPSIVVQNT